MRRAFSRVAHEPACIDYLSDAIELEFVDRVETPISIIGLAIHLHLVGLSIQKPGEFLANFGIDRCRSTVHYWAKKAGLNPRSGRSPEKIALDESVVKIDGD